MTSAGENKRDRIQRQNKDNLFGGKEPQSEQATVRPYPAPEVLIYDVLVRDRPSQTLSKSQREGKVSWPVHPGENEHDRKRLH